MLGSQYIRADQLKEEMQKLYFDLEKLSLYTPIVKALKDNPDLEEYPGIDLNSLLQRLKFEDSESIKGSGRDDLFINLLGSKN